MTASPERIKALPLRQEHVATYLRLPECRARDIAAALGLLKVWNAAPADCRRESVIQAGYKMTIMGRLAYEVERVTGPVA